ncbi:uncharacterized protein GVI51_L02871 [Nakaseomyces glabratus]|uniref:TRIP4/RQT4 C2HC5-type zinc finger domain-containing protein n=1 Tax=Candida glabrata (strain ATCC 2001 / BCRC 20586 / JCM 3761 / NBRC 0622 / NRRL Y-65 / CBS 138) TaxID=284593 RepID=Q6FLI9_CANGA|nr:uncharacterized protein CAGL0L03069g [Nakaseomyces glabratus]KAH7595385.1 putative zinc finger motif, C2HC5-type [Nakaseomyces glabratus]KAH7601817.1 putative zinc finger motif, C2HC5-type [Nakaseomyces glabratus]QHS68574.1 uncharacterized protein GVI51_L02871 [Nakaseomyces glabratus]CAG61875.1 unnamed protein product [Nakaseomyces glabratus]|eukprot:XP_448905.1 uncharacterized protein CAGL0L03069g [[Candida] glabrata]
MTQQKAIDYAIATIPDILPLEADEIRTLCDQIIKSCNGSPEQIAEGFMGILGQEELVFDFVIRFNELYNEEVSVRKETPSNPNEPSNEATPVRIKTSESKALESNIKKSQEIKPTKPATVKSKPIESGSLVSSKLDQVVSKPEKQLNTTQKKNRKVQSLQEIDEIVKILEVERENKNSDDYACNCQARRHPLFELVPNCLSCGKIICIKEGLHLNNCSFCGEELIPINERLEIMDYLNKEKDEIINRKIVEAPVSRKKKPENSYKISTGMGKNMFEEHDKLMNFIEKQQEREKKRREVLNSNEAENDTPTHATNRDDVDEELQAAQDRLQKLLHYQDTSAERTKIIDNASDFSMSNETSIWGSAKERALLLKKQQRNMKKWEQLEKERNGKRDKYVVSMNINSDGKVTMSEVLKSDQTINAHSDDDLDEISDDEDREDLLNIKQLKSDINKEKSLNEEAAYNSEWDFEKDQKKFTVPVYYRSENSKNETQADTKLMQDEANNDNQVSNNWKNRVQFEQTEAGSLEQNILAII